MPKYYDEKASQNRDAGMLRGTGRAGLPQNVVISDWPKASYNMPEGLNDGLSGIDKQIKSDMQKKKPINSEKF
jgi:hypothetical protein